MAGAHAGTWGNDRYGGLALDWWFLVLMGCMNLVRGATHPLIADGGAARIAGIDLSQNGDGPILWWWRPLPVDAPGKYRPLLLVPLTVLALWSALRPQQAHATEERR